MLGPRTLFISGQSDAAGQLVGSPVRLGSCLAPVVEGTQTVSLPLLGELLSEETSVGGNACWFYFSFTENRTGLSFQNSCWIVFAFGEFTLMLIR